MLIAEQKSYLHELLDKMDESHLSEAEWFLRNLTAEQNNEELKRELRKRMENVVLAECYSREEAMNILQNGRPV